MEEDTSNKSNQENQTQRTKESNLQTGYFLYSMMQMMFLCRIVSVFHTVTSKTTPNDLIT
ncbi:hypothetical protein [Halobacillus yeomjeoni]|nr:hypothetical protein [Halobacillus yeomjeoni]